MDEIEVEIVEPEEEPYVNIDPIGLTKVPALYGHCVKAYKVMESEAYEAGLDADAKLVWEGHLTRLVSGQLNLSTPYYTGVTRALRSMGCIRQLRRGGGSTESMWELVKPPTEELWAGLSAKNSTIYTSRPTSKVRQSEQLIRDLQQRVARIEAALGLLP